ncbi:mucoidy inhibitor MuiA family protein [Fulvivirgaceae bacterium BMA12]|uniref:Mucoidy inhibitor MuiA family protein n=1 Tax=Agaribacillus aureus TaxID=3051825 RepID=A0ABT8L8M3_9BACT|nr:mucoidy inhibitor MuiA family protein [Fulvivirgaceae bacterium BMA12]
MKLKIFIFCVLIGSELSAQSDKELKTRINEVTVFLSGAQINRIGEQKILPGKTRMVIKDLSPFVDEKSVQVKAEGDFTILSVKHQFNYLHTLAKNKTLDSLQAAIVALKNNIAREEGKLLVLKEKQSLLDENKDLGGYNNGASLTELKAAMEFYEKELMTIKDQELTIKNKISGHKKELAKIEKQIKDVASLDQQPSSEIVIMTEAKKNTAATFKISYLVSNAGWYPNYDVRVKDVASPISLNYKADVYQNTGVDWRNVKLKFSNADPNQSGLAPDLNTWYLNYARNTIFRNVQNGVTSNNIKNVSGKVLDETGEPLPGVNIIVKGTTVGTVTDFNGNYRLTLPNNAAYLTFSFIGYQPQDMPITQSNIDLNMTPDIMRLEEVVAIGYGLQGKMAGVSERKSKPVRSKAETITTTTIENQTTVEFQVDIPYSIPSKGAKISVALKQHSIEAMYEYYAVPKKDKDAFLLARIPNWDQYNLLEGEANLYFEDSFVGRTILEAKKLTDTLSISLGRDKNIVLGRTSVDRFTKKRTVGANKIESIGFQILARNKKSQSIRLIVYDQIPVSAINEIQINPRDFGNGDYDEKTGKISWTLLLEPNQQEEFPLKYEVKYPKREKLILE